MKVNQLKAGVMLSYISEAIAVVAALVYTPVMLRLLGQAEYGLYQLAASTISYLSLLGLGFSSSYIRYYSKYKVNNDSNGIAKLNGMFMTVFIVIGIVCAIVGGVLVASIDIIFKASLSADEIKTARILMVLMVFNFTISFPGSVFSTYITANEKYIFLRIINIIKNILNPLLTLPLLLVGYKSIAVVAIQTVLAVSTFVINWLYCNKKLEMQTNFKNFDWGILKSLFMFSFWVFLNEIIDQVNWQVDKFVLGIISGTVTVAVYGVASQLNSLYLMFSTSVSSVFVPRVNKIVAEGDDNKHLTDLFVRVGRIQFIILMLMISGFIIFGRYFIKIWAGDNYNGSYYIALLLMTPATVPYIQSLGVQIQRAKNMHQFRSIVYFVIAILNVIASIPLAKLYGGIGAAMGTSLSIIIGNGFIMNVYYHKKIGLDIIYFWKQIAKFIPALIIPAMFGLVVMKYIDMDSILIFVTLTLIYVGIYSLSMWLFGMNKSEKELLAAPLRRILRK